MESYGNLNQTGMLACNAEIPYLFSCY